MHRNRRKNSGEIPNKEYKGGGWERDSERKMNTWKILTLFLCTLGKSKSTCLSSKRLSNSCNFFSFSFFRTYSKRRCLALRGCTRVRIFYFHFLENQKNSAVTLLAHTEVTDVIYYGFAKTTHNSEANFVWDIPSPLQNSWV